MQKILLINGLIVTSDDCIYGDLLIEGERIIKIASSISPSSIKGNVEIIDVRGCYVFPGLIDGQVHFREPGLTDKGTIYTESRAAIAGGTTSFVEQPNTKPFVDSIDLLKMKLEIASKTSFANYGFNLGATNNNIEKLRFAVGQHPELFGAIKVFMGSTTGNVLVDNSNTLENIFELPKLCITHCEDEATIKANLEIYKKQFGDNIPMELHPIIRNEEACFKSSSLAVSLAKKYGTRLHLYHISTGKELSLLTNKIPLEQKRITAEVCAHHLWFNDSDYARLGSHIKWNPAIKEKQNSNDLLNAIASGFIDTLSTDHAPHTLEDKKLPYMQCPSGAPLVQHNLTMLMELYGQGKISSPHIIAKLAAHNQATIFRIKERGELAEGNFADITVFDANSQWTVAPENTFYKCGWSPLTGTTFSGRVKRTFVNGTQVYHFDKEQGHSFLEEPKGMQLVFGRH